MVETQDILAGDVEQALNSAFLHAIGAEEWMAETPINRFEEVVTQPTTPEAAKQNNTNVKNTTLKNTNWATAATAPPPPQPALLPPSLTELDSLEKLQEALQQYTGCPLKAGAKNLVFGVGNPNADIMLLGEAPGEIEDRKGIPFSGPSGQLLAKMLAAIGLTMEEVYIANTVYWHPPGNRAPSTAEVVSCWPYVERHISLIQPKILILVGGVAAKAVLKTKDGIMRCRGNVAPYHNPYLQAPVTTLAMYHPAFLLRQPAQKALAWRDLLKLKEMISA